jgi:ABC-type multidrug transport system ATPase subunit
MLEIKELTKYYGKTLALENVSFTMDNGVYSLLGPNGAGKTTLLNIITQNLISYTGEVLWNGKPIIALGALFRELLGYMPQQQQVYPRFTVERFLFYIAALKGLSKKEAAKQIDELIDLCNLVDKRKMRLKTLSGGMKQRVLIAQALLGNPKLIILDEPTAGLDPKERIRIRNLVAKIGLNRIVIIATHIVSDVELIAREVFFLQRGRIIEHGTLDDLYMKMNRFVWDVVVKDDNIDEVTERYRVVNIMRQDDGVHLRVISESPIKGGSLVAPSLEDMYLHLFGDSE